MIKQTLTYLNMYTSIWMHGCCGLQGLCEKVNILLSVLNAHLHDQPFILSVLKSPLCQCYDMMYCKIGRMLVKHVIKHV